MEIIKIILLALLVVGVVAVAFFLMAIWRAILGKSSVDLKLATTITAQMKKLESLDKNLSEYSGTNRDLKKVMKDGVDTLKKIYNKSNENS